MPNKKKYSLRERKYARTKLSLLDAAVQEMENTSLDKISVSALCEKTDVSEATFFNYFAKKADLLDYFIQLWNLELTWHHHHSKAQGLGLLEASFDQIAQQFHKNPGVMAEIISHQTRQRNKPTLPVIGQAERLQAFPKLEHIETQEIEGLDHMWVRAIEQAINRNELPENTHLATTITGLAAIFYGVPLALGQHKLTAITRLYRQQINIYLTGIKATSKR